MSIVVTGGAGFLGHHLVQLLLDQGHRVVVMDSLWTGSRDNIRCFQDDPNFHHIICDVREPLPDIPDVTQIYHLASPASPDEFEVSPIAILETNFLGTKNVLDLAVKRKARVLLASTSEIYGDPQVSCQPETYRGNVNSFGPRSCYDEGKRSLEALAYAYQTSQGVEVRIARIFNAYGPHMRVDDGRAVPNFIVAAMEGRPLTVYGDGSATRCFQHAGDCVRGLAALMNSDYSGGPVNIGSDREVPVGDIATIIADVVAERMSGGKDGSNKKKENKVEVRFLPKREDDPTQRKPDIRLAEKVLGWRPRIPLEEGIASTVDWFIETRRNGGMEQHVTSENQIST